MQPLTHHQILALVAPFSRAGWQVDLAASQRQERRLAFRAQQLPASEGLHPALAASLWLQAPEGEPFILGRRLASADGLEAELQASGPDAGALLDRLSAVPVGRQWCMGPGWTLAWQHRVAGPPGAPADGLQATAATVQLPGFCLHWSPPPVHSRLGVLRLTADGGADDLPEDLLAVLGYPWTRLVRQDGGWSADLRQRGNGLAAHVQVEQRLAATAAHLARTLAAAPAQFHLRHRAARWRVVLRRAVPAAISLGLVAAAAAVPRLSLAPESVLRMLILNAPPLLLIGFFCLREVPRIEIPPLPRPLRQPAWQPPHADGTAPPAQLQQGAAACPPTR